MTSENKKEKCPICKEDKCYHSPRTKKIVLIMQDKKENRLVKCPECTNAWYSEYINGYCPFCKRWEDFIVKQPQTPDPIRKFNKCPKCIKTDNSDFSCFMLHTPKEEREKIWKEVAEKASADQRKILETPDIERVMSEFDKKFNIGFENQGIIFTDNDGIDDVKRAIPLSVVKDFIRQIYKEAKQEGKDEILDELRFYGYGDILDKFNLEKAQNEVLNQARNK